MCKRDGGRGNGLRRERPISERMSARIGGHRVGLCKDCQGPAEDGEQIGAQFHSS